MRETERAREVTVGELRRELEPIAQGRETGYSREERKAAFELLNGIERLDRDERVAVRGDWHATLREPAAVKDQVREKAEALAERSRAREQAREHDRGWSW